MLGISHINITNNIESNNSIIKKIIDNDIFTFSLIILLLCTCSLYYITRYKYNNLLKYMLFTNSGYNSNLINTNE